MKPLPVAVPESRFSLKRVPNSTGLVSESRRSAHCPMWYSQFIRDRIGSSPKSTRILQKSTHGRKDVSHSLNSANPP